jgi:hypothetical protein
MSVADIVAQVQLVQKVMGKVMQEGEHYGKIPGCGDKKCLLQPGAQKLTLTFRLAPKYIIQDVDLPGGHKEYRVTCELHSITTKDFWGAGVGCCSTMESKYRYRGGQRKCPDCGKESIIKGKDFKNPNGPGEWVCWKKKGGCGHTWPIGTPIIENQSEEKVENENPADCWNTVLKMAKKRAYVDATITATAASDIFTQDIDDTDERGETSSEPPKGSQTSRPADPPKTTTQAQNASQTSQSAQKPPQNTPTVKVASLKTKDWMTSAIISAGLEQLATEYFVKAGQILPNEGIAELDLRFVPVTTNELKALLAKIKDFGNGAPAEPAFEPHYPPGMPGQKIAEATRQNTQQQQPAAAVDPNKDPIALKVEALRKADPEWFLKIIVPIPRKGQKRVDYLKQPDTIGSLYLASKQGDDGGESNRRLWGFVHHYQPQPWEKNDGTKVPPSESDHIFRYALDDFADVHGNKEANPGDDEPAHGPSSLAPDNLPEEDSDIPF